MFIAYEKAEGGLQNFPANNGHPQVGVWYRKYDHQLYNGFFIYGTPIIITNADLRKNARVEVGVIIVPEMLQTLVRFLALAVPTLK